MLQAGKKYTFQGRPGAAVYHFVGLAQDGKAVMQAKDGLLFETDQNDKYVEYKEPVVHQWIMTWLKKEDSAGAVFPSCRQATQQEPDWYSMGYKKLHWQLVTFEEK